MRLDSSRIIIKDSCILFDLIDLGLMANFFELDYLVYTTNFVLVEVTENEQQVEVNKYIESGGLIVDKQGTYESILAIHEECKGLSLTDCSVIEFAMRSDGLILSADKALRNEAIRRRCKVGGVLWIIRELCETTIISGEEAIRKLELYSSINTRAPRKEIAMLINDLSKYRS